MSDRYFMNVVETRTVSPNPRRSDYELILTTGVDANWPSQSQIPLSTRRVVYHVIARGTPFRVDVPVREDRPAFSYMDVKEYNVGDFYDEQEARGWRRICMELDRRIGCDYFPFYFVVHGYESPVYPMAVPWPQSLVSFDPMI